MSFLVVANRYLWVQVATLNFLALASIIFLLWFRPLESTNLVEVFNECTLLVLTYFLWCFTDIIGDPVTRYELGFVFIAIALANVAYHLISMIIDTLIKCRLKCKLRKALKEARKQQLQKKLSNRDE